MTTQGHEGPERDTEPPPEHSGGAPVLEPGSTFGRYTIVRRIGKGGMATVFEARHVDLHKRVALKVLHHWLSLRIDVVQRFMLEARAASRLSHPHVVAITDIGAVSGSPFLAMELLDGEELSAIVDRDGPMPVERLADVMLPLISAVAAAHEAGVVHRDLKPDNIFLAKRRPYGEHPVLLDFGISKFDAGQQVQPLTAAGEVLGTPPYMAPEQVVLGMDAYDARSDQYALGVVLYECATRRLPFTAEPMHTLMQEIARGGPPPPSSIRREIPAGFDAVVARAMNVDPEQRFPSVSELGRALLPFASERARALWQAEFSAPATPPPQLTVTPAELRHVPLFSGAPDAELHELIGLTRTARVASGGALFDQGGRAASCFFVLSGELELFRTHGAETWEIETVGAGATLGLVALWDDFPRAVSAVAHTDVVALELKRSSLDAFGARCPILAAQLFDDAAAAAMARLKAAGARVSDLLDRPSAEASREALVRLSAAIGEWSAGVPRMR